MAKQLRFDDRVVVITGAGNGLGRAHALQFASRGAKVVVNDLGGAMTGGGKSSAAADAVVAEIKEAGGEAIANYDSVEDGRRIIEQTMDAFGRVDVVINNAGILRDVSFHKMTPDDWDLVYRVHVKGAFEVTHAAWPHMREQRYGRIVMTASAAGIYGNFGQANYSMAKLGLLGFANTLAVEGLGRGIHANTVAPIAGSRLTETVLPKELIDALRPEYVSPLVAWLAHEDCEESGGLFEVGGGFFGKLRWQRAKGQMLRLGRDMSPEDVQRSWSVIADLEDATYPASVAESMGPILDNINAGQSRGGNEYIDVDAVMAYEFPSGTTSYDEKDLALYALGVGAASDPMDEAELRQVFELHQDGFVALPSYGVIPAINHFLTLAKQGHLPDGFNFGLERILHGEQRVELVRPLPPKAELTHEMRVKDVYDKGKHAMIDVEAKSFDADGDLVMTNNIMIVGRGIGGWGGDRGPTAAKHVVPDRAPDATIEQKVDANQALLYRLSGDWNPLHADPNFASAMGFERPILHGLCTMGYAVRHVVSSFAPDKDPRYVRAMDVRMSASVFPGETLVTEMWKEDGKVVFTTKVKERGDVALSQAAIELWDALPEPKAKKKPAAAAAAPKEAAVDATPISADVFAGISAYVEKNAADVASIATVYQFQLSGPDSVWTLDLKSSPPAVAQGDSVKADCTLALSDADFMAMCAGEKDPQQMFMGGELKISGNLMASQKLTFLQKLDPQLVLDAAKARAGSGGGAAPAAPAALTSAVVFGAIGGYVAAHPELVDQIKTVYQFQLKDPDSVWTLDLKAGAVNPGESAKADCTLALTDADFMAMVKGEKDPQQMFMGGELKISGNLMASQKLTFLQKVDPKEFEAAASAAPVAAPVAAAPSRTAVAGAVQAALEARLNDKPELAEEVQADLRFSVTDPEASFTVRLKDGASVGADDGEVTTTFHIADEDLERLVKGDADARDLYQRGQLRIDGDLSVAHRLGFLKNLI